MKKVKEGQVVPTESGIQVQQDTSVESFIATAIQKNVPVETLEKLLELRSRVKADMAKEAFIVAMSRFQGDCPVIEKKEAVNNKDNKSVRYRYAPLDHIVKQVKGLLAQHGLSYTVNVSNETGFVSAIVVVTHIMGHSETSSFKVPIDESSYMSQPQRYAAALTFAKRYAFCNAFGILTGDEDNDAKPSNEPKQSQQPYPAKPEDKNEGRPCPECDGVLKMAANESVPEKWILKCSKYGRSRADGKPVCRRLLRVGAEYPEKQAEQPQQSPVPTTDTTTTATGITDEDVSKKMDQLDPVKTPGPAKPRARAKEPAVPEGEQRIEDIPF